MQSFAKLSRSLSVPCTLLLDLLEIISQVGPVCSLKRWKTTNLLVDPVGLPVLAVETMCESVAVWQNFPMIWISDDARPSKCRNQRNLASQTQWAHQMNLQIHHHLLARYRSQRPFILATLNSHLGKTKPAKEVRLGELDRDKETRPRPRVL